MDPRVMPSYPTLADDVGKRFWKGFTSFHYDVTGVFLIVTAEALSRDSLHSFIVEEQVCGFIVLTSDLNQKLVSRVYLRPFLTSC